MDFLANIFLALILWWNPLPATPTIVHGPVPMFESKEFTIESVPINKKLGATLTEVPDKTQVFNRTVYFANFQDPARNNVTIRVEIKEDQYDRSEYPYRPSYVWTGNTRHETTQAVPTALKGGEYAVVLGMPEAVQSTTTDGVIWMPTKAYRVKEAGKEEQILVNLPK